MEDDLRVEVVFFWCGSFLRPRVEDGVRVSMDAGTKLDRFLIGRSQVQILLLHERREPNRQRQQQGEKHAKHDRHNAIHWASAHGWPFWRPVDSARPPIHFCGGPCLLGGRPLNVPECDGAQ